MSFAFPKMHVNLFRKPLTRKHKVNQPTTLTLSAYYQCYNHYLFMSEIKPVFATSTNIVFCCNRLYLPYLSVVLTSLISHTKKTHHYDIVILYNQRCGPPRYHPKKFCRPNISVRLIKIDLEKLSSGADFFVHRYYVPEVYMRFFIPQIFTHYQRIIYLDVDTLVLEDIAELDKFPLHHQSLAANIDFTAQVPHSYQFQLYCHYNLSLTQIEKYFCSGVMIMNLPKLRQENFTANALAKLKQLKTPLYVDQDVFNCLYAGKIALLPNRWNTMTICFDPQISAQAASNPSLKTALEKYYQSIKQPAIIHFSGKSKPWIIRRQPFGKLWWQYAYHSPSMATLCQRKMWFYLDFLWHKMCSLLKCLSQKITTSWQSGLTLISWWQVKAQPQTILLVEPNPYHGEIVASLATYCQALGFRLVYLLHPTLNKESITAILPKHPQNTLLFAPPKLQRLILKSHKITRFHRVIFSSQEINVGKKYLSYQQIFQLPKEVKPIVIQHHEKKELGKNQTTISLLAANKHQLPVIYPVTLGISTPHQLKPKITFVVIGKIEKQRKNFSLLLNAVSQLLGENKNNFKIEMIGSLKPHGFSPLLSAYFNFHSRLDYPQMLHVIERSDFILSLLDPQLTAHQAYAGEKVSGSWINSVALTKPCILHSYFSKYYHFNHKNSLLYKNNELLKNTMKRALAMSAAEYQLLVKELTKDRQHLQELSLKTLAKLFSSEQ